jgi:hypothetical protein
MEVFEEREQRFFPILFFFEKRFINSQSQDTFKSEETKGIKKPGKLVVLIHSSAKLAPCCAELMSHSVRFFPEVFDRPQVQSIQ